MLKNKKSIIVGGIALAVILFGVYLASGDSYEEGNEWRLELGEALTEEFIKENSEAEKFSIHEESLDLIDKKHPVGEYLVRLIHKETILGKRGEDHKVIVQDTQGPVVKQIKNLKFIVGENFTFDDVDLKDYFEITDESEFKVDLDFESIKTDEEGTYKTKLTAVDDYKNKTDIEVEIVIEFEPVKEPEKITDTTTSEKTETTQGTKPSGNGGSQSNSGGQTNLGGANKPAPAPKPKPAQATYVNGIIVVNKKNPVPEGWSAYEDPTAVGQLKALIAAMQKEGLNVSNGYSGYRTVEYQTGLYNRYVAQDGQAAADTYSARGGYSEHHTGLAFDLLHSNGTLVTGAAEADYIAKNAHKYGFIVRYKANKTHITGYMAEPWHIRYVGESHASMIYDSGLSLEEYLGVAGGDY